MPHNHICVSVCNLYYERAPYIQIQSNPPSLRARACRVMSRFSARWLGTTSLMRCPTRKTSPTTHHLILISPTLHPGPWFPHRVNLGFSPSLSAAYAYQYSRSSYRDLIWSPRSERAMASQSAPPQSVHDFTVKDARGNDIDLSIYKGKVLIIVNVASQCGLTNSNYTELAQLYDKYKDQGLEILAFPCNQFGSQEPGSNEQILEFACTRFKAEYPIFSKVDVNGENAAPLYKFMKSAKGSLFGDGIKWNFAKFLVDRQGNVVDRYAPTTSPLSIEKDIKKLL